MEMEILLVVEMVVTMIPMMLGVMTVTMIPRP